MPNKDSLREELTAISQIPSHYCNCDACHEHRVFKIEDIENLLTSHIEEAERNKLNLWKDDILGGFIPKCSFCGRKTAKVIGQVAQGKTAQELNSLPRNWGYYCQKCYDEGMELEREAMYG